MPPEKKAPELAGNGAETTIGNRNKFRQQTTSDHGQGASETFEDLSDAFTLLEIRPREYVEYEQNDFGGSGNWRLRKVSEAQRSALAKFGITFPREDCSLNQGTAAQILNRLIRRIKAGKCRYQDAVLLHRLGVKNSINLSQREARRLFKAM